MDDATLDDELYHDMNDEMMAELQRSPKVQVDPRPLCGRQMWFPTVLPHFWDRRYASYNSNRRRKR